MTPLPAAVLRVLRPVAALASGALFALGLNLSGMTQPMKILGFLDFTGRYTGAWDPSLIVVMFSALAVHFVARRLVLRRAAPVLDARFFEPSAGRVDAALVGGSLLWGAGWGLTGLCPGPVLAAVADLNGPVVIFFLAMLGGMGLHHALSSADAARRVPPPAAPSAGGSRVDTP